MLQRAGVTPKPERNQAVSEFFQSGKTMAAWSKERQINRYTLHNWVEEYRQETKLAQRSCEWVELEINTAAQDIVPTKDTAVKVAAVPYTPIRISIGNMHIEVTTGFDETALAAVIKAVK